MGLVGWYKERVLATQRLPIREYYLFFLSKVWGAFAVGVLFASYFWWVDWAPFGWFVLLLALLLAMPTLRGVLVKSRAP